MISNIVLFVCEKDNLASYEPEKCSVCGNDFIEVEYVKLDAVKPYLDELLAAREYFHFITDRGNIRTFESMKNNKTNRMAFESIKARSVKILDKWRKAYVTVEGN